MTFHEGFTDREGVGCATKMKGVERRSCDGGNADDTANTPEHVARMCVLEHCK